MRLQVADRGTALVNIDRFTFQRLKAR
jgi:hypothetical protein